MSTEVEGPDIAAALRDVSEQLAALTARVTALEATAAGATVPAPAPAAVPEAPGSAEPARPAEPAATEAGSGVPDEETLLVISAAIAAFLGKKPHIRQIRLVGSSTWAQQGRVSIHTSHAFARSGAAL